MWGLRHQHFSLKMNVLNQEEGKKYNLLDEIWICQPISGAYPDLFHKRLGLTMIVKGQLISKFFQKTNENKLTWGTKVVKLN